jgi:hypothetical protein
MVNEGGRTSERKKLDDVLDAQIHSAIKGSPMAQRDVIHSAREIEQRKQEQAALLAVQLEAQEKAKAESDKLCFDYFVKLKHGQREAWDTALAEGRVEPDFQWPHPDHILLDHSRRKWRSRGPMEPADELHFRWVRIERDAAFVEMVLKARARAKFEKGLAEIWMLTMTTLDAQLPLR